VEGVWAMGRAGGRRRRLVGENWFSPDGRHARRLWLGDESLRHGIESWKRW
jgi:hypothetical protein